MTRLFRRAARRPASAPVDVPPLGALDAATLNLKQYGLVLGRAFHDAMAARSAAEPAPVALGWRPCRQADMETDWFLWWCRALGLGPVAHRKLWEFAWIAQELHAAGALRPGARALGFGCGEEPIPAWLASHGVDVLATDLAAEASAAAGWAASGQHAGSLASLFDPKLVARETFEARVSHRFVDMNAVPDDLTGFDVCWSICALEHLGSLEAGLAFVERSLETLRPGGLALHTTEFAYMSDAETIAEGPTVLYRRRDFEALADRLRARGCEVGPVGFEVGEGPLDRYVDFPPFDFDLRRGGEGVRRAFAGPPGHLNLLFADIPTTCFGISVRAPA